MPSIITHSIVGLAAGTAVARRQMPKRFWALTLLCPVLPDVDVAAFAFGIPYAHLFGHRGFFHSLFFALLVGIAIGWLFFRKERRWWLYAGYLSLITASHGLLDACTSGGLGIALLAPFDSTRYFFPWTPIRVSPIGLRPFFSKWGAQVLLSEMRWVWLPAGAVAISSLLLRQPSKAGELS